MHPHLIRPTSQLQVPPILLQMPPHLLRPTPQLQVPQILLRMHPHLIQPTPQLQVPPILLRIYPHLCRPTRQLQAPLQVQPYQRVEEQLRLLRQLTTRHQRAPNPPLHHTPRYQRAPPHQQAQQPGRRTSKSVTVTKKEDRNFNPPYCKRRGVVVRRG